jgi:hypothetical protein
MTATRPGSRARCPAKSSSRSRTILTVRVSEMNSVSCGGPASLVQSFATALWAPDALCEMARAGIVGVNWHIRSVSTNAPVEFDAHGIQARPELYGLALYAGMIDPGAILTRVRTHPSLASVKVWAFRSRRHVRLLIINRGARTLSAGIPLPPGIHETSGSLVRLLAPSLAARSDVTLAGRTIGSDGRWHGRPHVETVRLRAGSYRTRIRGYSAALLTLS